MNLERARKIKADMDHYIQLTESYTTRDMGSLIIKHYAHTGSIKQVTEILNQFGYDITKEEVTRVIKGKPQDELHKVVRTYYMLKVKKKTY